MITTSQPPPTVACDRFESVHGESGNGTSEVGVIVTITGVITAKRGYCQTRFLNTYRTWASWIYPIALGTGLLECSGRIAGRFFVFGKRGPGRGKLKRGHTREIWSGDRRRTLPRRFTRARLRCHSLIRRLAVKCETFAAFAKSSLLIRSSIPPGTPWPIVRARVRRTLATRCRAL